MAIEPERPLYLQADLVTQAQIRLRMTGLSRVIQALDTSEGSWEMDIVNVLAGELAAAAIMPANVMARIYTDTATGADLDAIANDVGIDPRKRAGFATGTVLITAPAGTVINAGTRVATQQRPQWAYATNVLTSVPVGATNVAVSATALVAGAGGNQPIGAVKQLIDNIVGVTAVTNTTEMGGGSEVETDTDLRARIKTARRERAASGNRADVRNLALDVVGVGGAEVMYPDTGNPVVQPGSMRVTVVDANHLPVSQQVVDAVRDALSMPWRQTVEAELLALSGTGGSVVADAGAVGGSAIRLAYDAAGPAVLTHNRIDSFLNQGGIWELWLVMRVATPGVGNFLEARIVNTFANATAPISPLSATLADFILTNAANYPAAYTLVYLGDFFMNSTIAQFQLVLTRLAADNLSQVYIDEVFYRSVDQRTDILHQGLPGGWRVIVQPPATVPLDVHVTLTYVSGFSQATVNAAVRAAIVAYLGTLPFGTGGNRIVQVGAIGDAIFNTNGVSSYDFSTLQVNAAQQNISVTPEQVPVLRDLVINGVAA